MPLRRWRVTCASTLSIIFMLLAGGCGPSTHRLGGATSAPVESRSHTVVIPVIALTDFHGWLAPLQPRRSPQYYGGIGNLAAMLEHREKLSGDNAVFVDNGDMWTGQTAATLLKGAPVVEIYNLLSFSAVNVANHEFDFGQESLQARIEQARFPFLGANIYRAGTDDRPSYVRPWTIVERNGVAVGILGLCYIGTPQTTMAKNVADLEFREYAATLRRELPEVRKAGAEVVVVLLHDEVEAGVELFEKNTDLDVDVVVAGQNHRKGRAVVRRTKIVNPGPFGRSYTRFDIEFDIRTRQVLRVVDQTVDVTGEVGAPPYPVPEAVRAVVERAMAHAESTTSERIGRLDVPLPTGTFGESPLGHFVVDSWLQAMPEADFAMLNHGGLRQSIESGPVTMSDLLSAMPFENNIQRVKLTGAQIRSQLAIDKPVVGGMTWAYRQSEGPGKARTVVEVFDMDGEPIADRKVYEVLIIDFMYTGGDGFTFQSMDRNPIDTGLSWREPVIRALRPSTNGTPLTPMGGVVGGLRARKLD